MSKAIGTSLSPRRIEKKRTRKLAEPSNVKGKSEELVQTLVTAPTESANELKWTKM